MVFGFWRAGRRSAGFFLPGVLTVIAISACDPLPQITPVPATTETSAASQTPTLVSTPAPEASPSPTEIPAAIQIPTSASVPTSESLPDLVIEIEARVKSSPDIEWGDDCVVPSGAGLPFHVGELTVRIGNVGGGDAGSFTVLLNNVITETVDGLRAGASAMIVVSTTLRSDNVAVVDADSSIDESDESNNSAETFILIPTLVPPAPTCTPEPH